jgi:biotin operon repressor
MSTRQIADVTNSCAVHSDIAGLRANGVTVEVKAMGNTVEHRRVFYYRLAERAPMLPGMEEAAT